MNKSIFWYLILIMPVVLVYFLHDILQPFFIAFIFAYLLEPVIEKLYRILQINRNTITILIFLFFISGFALCSIILLPIIYNQLRLFIMKIPVYKKNFEQLIHQVTDKIGDYDSDIANKFLDFSDNAIGSIFTLLANITNHIWDYTLATINFFAIAFLVPIILYYFLRDWNHIILVVESFLPPKRKGKIRKILQSVNELLSAYIRGQLNICVILSCYYVLGFTFIGIDLALLLGLVSGFLVIIPFIGSLISVLIAVTSCYLTHGYSASLLCTIVLFAIGHMVEGYFLSPKIIGDRIGLHPLWILFAVFTGGSLFGLSGVFFAVPVAGIMKLFLKQLTIYYKSSDIYHD